MIAVGALAGCANSSDHPAGPGSPGEPGEPRPMTPQSTQDPPPHLPGDKSIKINIQPGASIRGNSAFGTNPLVIPVGTSVQWINQDSMPHTMTSANIAGSLKSANLAPGKSYSFTFTQAGDFPYFCEIHPSMRGMVRVTSSAAALH